MLVWFNPSTNHWSGSNAVGFYSGNNDGTNSGAVVKYSGTYSTSADYYVNPGTTYLMLAKLDVTTGADSITLWMKTESEKPVQRSESRHATVRIERDEYSRQHPWADRYFVRKWVRHVRRLVFGETLQDVTMVPEPSTVVLLLSALAAAAIYRRRAAVARWKRPLQRFQRVDDVATRWPLVFDAGGGGPAGGARPARGGRWDRNRWGRSRGPGGSRRSCPGPGATCRRIGTPRRRQTN